MAAAAQSFVGPKARGGVGGRSLGPATVTEVGPATLQARLSTGEIVSPKLALAFPFTPAVGDCVLVIGQGDRHYVIGVLSSTGRTELHFPGNVEVRAVDGTLDLHGSEGISLRGAEVDLRTRHLTVVAERVTEAFGSVFTRVKALLSVHAGTSDTVVHGEWSNRSERAAITSQEVVSVNGKEVHLG